MLKLPATEAALLRDVIEPALQVLPVTMDSPRARCLLIAIAKQESGIAARRQIIASKGATTFGAAAGLWQFERGGVQGVLQHASTEDLAVMVCKHFKVNPDARSVWTAIQTNDELACCFARLLLWTHPMPLTANDLGSESAAFGYYEWLWRPGAAKTPEGRAACLNRWRKAWPAAVNAVN